MVHLSQRKLGQNLKAAREAQNISREELAERLNVTRDAVSKWEQGMRCPDIEMLANLSRELNFNIQEICDASLKESHSEEILQGVGVGILILSLLGVMSLGFLHMSRNSFTDDIGTEAFVGTEGAPTIAEQKPSTEAVTEAPTTSSSENKGYVYEKDEQGRVVQIEDKDVSMSGGGQKIQSDGFVEMLKGRAKQLAEEYIPFVYEVQVEERDDQGMYTFKVYETTKEGFETSNRAFVHYQGNGRFVMARFSYQDEELTETEFIDEKEAYEKAVQGIVDKYGEEREVDLPSFEEPHELDLQYFEGRYRYVFKITDNKNSMGDAVDPAKDHHYLYTVDVDAVTGEVLLVASCL